MGRLSWGLDSGGGLKAQLFSDEVKEVLLEVGLQGAPACRLYWEAEGETERWLRVPKGEQELSGATPRQQRFLVYGGRLPGGDHHRAVLIASHNTRSGDRRGEERLWDRWCWDEERIALSVERLSPAYLVADRSRRSLGRLARVARRSVEQLFRFGNGGDATLELELKSLHPALSLGNSRLQLEGGQVAALGAELGLLDLEVGVKHSLEFEVHSVQEEQRYRFSVSFELVEPKVELPVIGVDFGTSTSKVALLGDGQIQQVTFDGRELFPSHLYLYPDGRMVIGEEASEFRGEPNYLRNLKSLLGNEEEWVEVLDPSTGERIKHDLHALVVAFLRRLFRRARESEDFQAYIGRGVEPTDVRLVLTVPAGTSREARDKTASVMSRILARLGFAEVTILVEPTAVSYLYAAEDPEMVEGKRILVFDCGAGTTDVSLLKVRLDRDPDEGFFFRQFDILGEAGEPIGGNLFDVHLYDRAVTRLSRASQESLRRLLWREQVGRSGPLLPPDDFPGRRKLRSQHLLEALRKTKEELSVGWSSARAAFPVVCPEALAPEEGLTLDRPALVKALRPLFEKLEALCSRVVRGAGLDEDDIDRVYLVGGSSFLPPLRSLLTRMFGADRVVCDEGRLTSISRGAVASASTRIRKVLTVDYVLSTPGLGEQVLVGAGAIYPTQQRSRVFLAPSAPPFLVTFRVYRRPDPKLGATQKMEALVAELPVRVDAGGSREITVRFEIDAFGDLVASAEYRHNGELLSFPLRYQRPPKWEKQSQPTGPDRSGR